MQRRKRDWKKLHEEYKISGMSITAFSKSKSIPTSTMATHFRLIEASADNDKAMFTKVEVLPETVVDTRNEKRAITLRAGKFDIVLDNDFNEELLTKALKVVNSLC